LYIGFALSASSLAEYPGAITFGIFAQPGSPYPGFEMDQPPDLAIRREQQETANKLRPSRAAKRSPV